MAPKILNVQRDFSSGELNVDALRRDDQPLQRAGCRNLRNFRILNSGAAISRAGRRAFFRGYTRVERLTLINSIDVYLAFGENSIAIFDTNGLLVSQRVSSIDYLWTKATARNIIWTVVPTTATQRDIVICFPGMPPRVASYNGSWTFADFSFGTDADGSQQMPFYRLSTPGITIQPSATSGSVTLTASAPVFDAGMIGTRIRWINHQIVITAVASSTSATGTVIRQLYASLDLTASGGFSGEYAVGDIIADSGGTEAEIFSVTVVAGSVTKISVNMMQARNFTTSTGIYGPNGQFVLTGTAVVAPGPSVQWDDALMSSYRGWPEACAFDQYRLIFYRFNSLPGGIAWSAIGLYKDFDVGALAGDAMLEIAPEKARVLHVAPKTDEIVLTDRGVWYIPISENNPLKPGSVVFKKVSVDAASTAPPTQTNEGVLFISAGKNRIVAVQPTGTLTQPWQTRETSLFHSHLFSAPFCIAASVGDDDFSERYVYVVNGDGTVVVGKYDVGKEWVGWVRYDSAAPAQWVNSYGSTTLFVSTYGANNIVEIQDPAYHLDAAILLNAPPAGLAPSGGLGPLFWWPSQSVDLMDGNKPLGTYATDANGNIVPNQPGEDLSSLTLVAGQRFSGTIEPFVQNADGGADQKQRTRPRRVTRVVVKTLNTIGGYRLASLYSGPGGISQPADGTEMISTREAIYRQDDNQALAPIVRDITTRFRPSGRSYDPRVALIKDVPGPLTVAEMTVEATT